jgi:hypothetical protein
VFKQTQCVALKSRSACCAAHHQRRPSLVIADVREMLRYAGQVLI